MKDCKENTAYSETFCQRLQSLMKENETRQEDIAQVVGVKRQTVGSWCNGKTVPDAVALGKMARHFNVSADYLIGLSDCPAVEPDLQAACDYTGLTSIACDYLNRMMNTEIKVHDTGVHMMLSDLLSENLFWRFLLNIYGCEGETLLLLEALEKDPCSDISFFARSLKVTRYSAIEAAARCIDKYIDTCTADKIDAFNQTHPEYTVTLKNGNFKIEKAGQ